MFLSYHVYQLFDIIWLIVLAEKFEIKVRVNHRNNRYRMRTWSRIMSPLFLMHALT